LLLNAFKLTRRAKEIESVTFLQGDFLEEIPAASRPTGHLLELPVGGFPQAVFRDKSDLLMIQRCLSDPLESVNNYLGEGKSFLPFPYMPCFPHNKNIFS
jgi:hypothetical protein